MGETLKPTTENQQPTEPQTAEPAPQAPTNNGSTILESAGVVLNGGFDPFERKGQEIDLRQELTKDVEDFAERGISRPDIGIPYSELERAYQEIAIENGEVKDEFSLESILAEFGSQPAEELAKQEKPAPVTTKEAPANIPKTAPVSSEIPSVANAKPDIDPNPNSATLAELEKVLAESQAYLDEYRRLMDQINIVGQKFYQNVERYNALQAQLAAETDDDPSRRFDARNILDSEHADDEKIA